MIATLLRLLGTVGRWAQRQERVRTRHEWDYFSAPVRCSACGEMYNRINYDDECDGVN